jgi:hypothetical protein
MLSGLKTSAVVLAGLLLGLLAAAGPPAGPCRATATSAWPRCGR